MSRRKPIKTFEPPPPRTYIYGIMKVLSPESGVY